MYMAIIFKHLFLRKSSANQSHMEPPSQEGAEVCINVPGHMTKMTATPAYGKKLLLQKKTSYDVETCSAITCSVSHILEGF